MLFSSSFVAVLSLALVVAANPVVTVRDNFVSLPMVKRMNFNGTGSLLQRDQKRAKMLKARGNRKLHGAHVDTIHDDAVISTPVTNQAVDYVLNVCRIKPLSRS